MTKTFGVKEARAADIFAKTKEQRLTVLAVVKMLGITINLKTQVKKQAEKLSTAIITIGKKANKLETKVDFLREKISDTANTKTNLFLTAKNWDI